MRGFAAGRDGERGRWLRWAVYGRDLSPRVRVCAAWEEFLTELELRLQDDMEKCDDVPAMMVGFATYGRAATSGVCEVVRVDVRELQRGGAEARERLLRLLSRSRAPGASLLNGVAQRRAGGGTALVVVRLELLDEGIARLCTIFSRLSSARGAPRLCAPHTGRGRTGMIGPL